MTMLTFVFNSLTRGSRECVNYLKSMILKLIIQDSSLDACYQIVLGWMPKNVTNEKSTLVHVMAWCLQAKGHYLRRCRPKSSYVLPITRYSIVHDKCLSYLSKSVCVIWYALSAIRSIFWWCRSVVGPKVMAPAIQWSSECNKNIHVIVHVTISS